MRAEEDWLELYRATILDAQQTWRRVSFPCIHVPLAVARHRVCSSSANRLRRVEGNRVSWDRNRNKIKSEKASATNVCIHLPLAISVHRIVHFGRRVPRLFCQSRWPPT